MKADRSQSKAPTQGDLCKRLQVSRTAINAWAKLPGAPSGNDYDEWKAFIAAHNLGVVGNRVSPGRESVLAEINIRKVRLLDLEIARKEGRMVLRSDVDARDAAIFTRQKAVLFAALESEFPGKAVGRSAVELRVLGRDLALRICDIFQKDIDHWEWTPENTKV